MIPQHKCSAYCDPDEGIHCLPIRSAPYKTLEDFQNKGWVKILGVSITNFRPEADVTPQVIEKSWTDLDRDKSAFNHNSDHVGYLVWMREKK